MIAASKSRSTPTIRRSFHTTMAREYEMLHRAFDWDEGVFAKIARTSLDAAFCDADTKTRILKTLEQANG